MHKYFLLLLMVIALSLPTPALAQDDDIILEPFTDTSIGISGVAPHGWLNVRPGFFRRGDSVHDPLILGYAFGPHMKIELIGPVAANLAGLDSLPASSESYEVGAFIWVIYHAEMDYYGTPALLDLAMTETEAGTYVVIFRASFEEYEALHDILFLPALASMMPVTMLEAEWEPVAAADYWPITGWRETTPEAQGMDSELLIAMIDYIIDEDYPMASITIIRHGYMVLDARFHPHEENARHRLASVTKSFTSAMVGIAITEGYIEGIDQPILAFFPDRVFDNMDENKQAITVGDLLTMSSGIEWTEMGTSYNSGENLATQMYTYTGDWLEFILDRPMAHEPGTHFAYSTGDSQLLSAIVQHATGMTMGEYANAKLFEPMGISTNWGKNPNGYSTGGWGLTMTTLDMAKFGYLYLHGGEWDGQHIVPPAWVEASTHGQVWEGYGYQWWIHADGFSAEGVGGQRIFVIPGLDLVVAMTGDLSTNDERIPEALLQTYVLPAARSTEPLPDNPKGVSDLEASLEAATSPAGRLPDTAQRISGRTFALNTNELGWQTFMVTFSPEKGFISINGDAEMPIGLGDEFAFASMVQSDGSEARVALQGSWTDEDTFTLRIRPVTEGARYTVRMTFAAENTLVVELSGDVDAQNIDGVMVDE